MNIMAQQKGNVPEIISPSDEDTDDLKEFSDFLFQNEVIQVTELDESSNSSTAQYTELVSVTKNGGKYYQINLSITYIISN